MLQDSSKQSWRELQGEPSPPCPTMYPPTCPSPGALTSSQAAQHGLPVAKAPSTTPEAALQSQTPFLPTPSSILHYLLHIFKSSLPAQTAPLQLSSITKEASQHSQGKEGKFPQSSTAQGATHRSLLLHLLNTTFPCRTKHWNRGQGLEIAAYFFISHPSCHPPPTFCRKQECN